ncbi:hypothetical protein ANANG_G00006670 [Anguilla anguilla]|uniref:Uncharacterized protein n=1 Tax=Anguilla anguilla TaxID=7936 RepID=A0A9D3MZ13_ANGAN|nr:hypothetical protein ANANG_G00006670 [Anguilla anguilla]
MPGRRSGGAVRSLLREGSGGRWEEGRPGRGGRGGESTCCSSGRQGRGGGGEGESFVLRFETKQDGESEAEKEKGGMVSLNLLQQWAGEREGESEPGIEGGVERAGESFVLHFKTEPGREEESLPSSSFPEAQGGDLGLACPPSQALVPLDGRELVFELGDEAKMVDSGSGERVQMIALIEGEGNASGTGGGFNAAGGVVGEGGEAMEGIFQLEGGEGIVIIEVSTSSLREGGMDGEGGVAEKTEGKGECGGEEAERDMGAGGQMKRDMEARSVGEREDNGREMQSGGGELQNEPQSSSHCDGPV